MDSHGSQQFFSTSRVGSSHPDPSQPAGGDPIRKKPWYFCCCETCSFLWTGGGGDVEVNALKGGGEFFS